jgi:hypothetical protein
MSVEDSFAPLLFELPYFYFKETVNIECYEDYCNV